MAGLLVAFLFIGGMSVGMVAGTGNFGFEHAWAILLLIAGSIVSASLVAAGVNFRKITRRGRTPS